MTNRYSPETDSSETFQGMNRCDDGDYVEYDEHIAIVHSLLERIAELETELERVKK